MPSQMLANVLMFVAWFGFFFFVPPKTAARFLMNLQILSILSKLGFLFAGEFIIQNFIQLDTLSGEKHVPRV